ncbi:Hypothetical protein GSB_27827 [Giardia duodenalis]|uniref:Uncharacterized protein n=2 Tax=Giardia intestinalis TaxID=5741 RepID=C6LXV9_GIAIB|nr:Hypothetical protein GL50581_3628 [Giardia intestinalis ATCC 50581]ESU42737.1 Hypothetical protein GSB_27827 [Giardia intestinalis]
MGTLHLQDLYIDDEDRMYFIPVSRSTSTGNAHRIASSYDRCATPVRASSLSKSHRAEEPVEEPPRRPALIPSPGTIRKYNTWRTATEPGPYAVEVLQQSNQNQIVSSADRAQAKIRRVSTSYGPSDQHSNQIHPGTHSHQHLVQTPSTPTSGIHTSGQLSYQSGYHQLTSSVPMPSCTLRAKSPSDGLRRSKSRGTEYPSKTRDRYDAPATTLPSLTNQITDLSRRKRTQDPLFSEPRLALPNANTYARAGMPQASAADPHFAGWKPKSLRAPSTSLSVQNKQQGLASLPVLSKVH